MEDRTFGGQGFNVRLIEMLEGDNKGEVIFKI